MKNEIAPAGQTLSTDLWTIGQGSTDYLMAVAAKSFVSFEVKLSPGKLSHAYIGKQPVGFIDPDTMDYVRWPAIVGQPFDYIGFLHSLADAYTKTAVCYFIGGETGLVKIGYSVDLKGRLLTLRASSPVPLDVLAVAKGGPLREAAYHEKFADMRRHGEWFERTPEIEAEIARLNDRSEAA